MAGLATCRPIMPACKPERAMTQKARQLYMSTGGDRWSLVHDGDSGRVFVRHEPNVPSGGQASDIPIRDFLAGDGNKPEQVELLRLIGTLAGMSVDE